jgi:hypothetical protein
MLKVDTLKGGNKQDIDLSEDPGINYIEKAI